MENAIVLEATLNGTFICQQDGYAYLLADEAPDAMDWHDAVEWCKALGDDYVLPPIEVLNACYQNENMRKQFTLGWYWSSTKTSEVSAFGYLFSTGFQNDYNENYDSYARAVRKIAI